MNFSQGIRFKFTYKLIFMCLVIGYFLLQGSVAFGANPSENAHAVCVGYFPASVSNAAELDTAIDCFGEEGVGSYTINLSADISLISSSNQISNTTAGAELVINGAGNSLDGGGTSGVRLIEVLTDTQVSLQNITLTGANSADGGAILNYGTLSVENTTISANTTDTAILNEGTLTVNHATIVNNVGVLPTNGIGIRNEAGATLSLTNSILANNPKDDCVNFGTLGTHTHNLIKDDSVLACGNIATDIIGSDPSLGALTDNGGDSDTHHPTTFSSLVINAASATHCLATDQRGVARVAGSCDMGAVEAVLFSVGDISIAEGTGGTITANVVVTRSDNALVNSVKALSANGTAEAGSDFTSVPATTLSFSAGGALTQNVPVTISTDNLVELNETFAINLSSAVNGLISDATGVGTITNDDSAIISLVANETGSENSGPLTFDVSLSAPVDVAVSVNFDTADGTATVANSDYSPLVNELVTFPDGSIANQQVNVSLGADSAIELDENFSVSIDSLANSGRNVSLGTVGRIGTIENDDTATLTLSGGVPQNEGDGLLPTIYTFTATLGTAVPSAFTVAYETGDGTATTVDSDYNAETGSLAFAGTLNETKTFTVSVNADTKVEANETFQVKLSSVAGTYASSIVLASNPFAATILNDDTAIVVLSGESITSTNTSKFEGDSGTTSYVFTGTLNVAVSEPFTVPISINDGTATVADGDYSDNDTVLVFDGTAGETETITVEVNGDEKVEADEQFQVALGAATGSTLIGSINVLGTPQTATIVNDDSASVSVTGGTSKLEGNSGVVTHTFTIVLNQAVQDGFTLPYTTSDGTATVADNDYQDNDDSLAFAGTINESKVVHVLVNGDTQVESSEIFNFALGNLTGTSLDDDISVSTTPVVSTIADDGDSATVTLSGAEAINEGDSGTTEYIFSATLDNAVQGGFDIAFAASGDSATSPNDFISQSGTLNFDGTMGEVQTITVTVNGDLIVEENESFTVALGAISGTSQVAKLSLSGTPAIGMITNDDGSVFTLALDSSSVVEGNTTVLATVSLNNPSALETRVDYTLTGLTATVGVDFQAASGTLVFAPNQTQKTFSITILDDGISETDETLSIDLDNAVGATLGIPRSAILTIIDDEGLPHVGFSQDSYSGGENTASIPVTVTLNRISSLPVTVQLQSADGTAQAPGDYQAVNQAVTIPAGDLTKVVQIVPANDSVYERDESLNLLLSGYVNGEAGSITTATLTIVEDDIAPTISVDDATVAETNELSSMIFTVRLSKAADVPISVSYATQDGTATVANDDYLAASGTVTIPAGQTTIGIEVKIIGDMQGEQSETFEIVLASPSDGNLNDATAVGRINNDDDYRSFLPAITTGRAPGPDLVVSNIQSTNGQVRVTIQNVGTQAVNGSFWVDLFVQPTILPTKPNDTVDSLGQRGIVWLVNNNALPLDPNESLVLTIDGVYYRADLTNFSGNILAGTPLVAHVDSANAASDYGAVREGHEISGGVYNNVFSTTVSADVLIP